MKNGGIGIISTVPLLVCDITTVGTRKITRSTGYTGMVRATMLVEVFIYPKQFSFVMAPLNGTPSSPLWNISVVCLLIPPQNVDGYPYILRNIGDKD